MYGNSSGGLIMNKKIINDEIAIAYEAIIENKIVDGQGQVQKTFRGQITSFGASIIMGSLLPAIAFFYDSEKSTVDRKKVLDAVYYILQARQKIGQDEKNLFEYAKKHQEESKEEILNASIALKLAINLFKLI